MIFTFKSLLLEAGTNYRASYAKPSDWAQLTDDQKLEAAIRDLLNKSTNEEIDLEKQKSNQNLINVAKQIINIKDSLDPLKGNSLIQDIATVYEQDKNVNPKNIEALINIVKKDSSIEVFDSDDDENNYFANPNLYKDGPSDVQYRVKIFSSLLNDSERKKFFSSKATLDVNSINIDKLLKNSQGSLKDGDYIPTGLIDQGNWKVPDELADPNKSIADLNNEDKLDKLDTIYKWVEFWTTKLKEKNSAKEDRDNEDESNAQRSSKDLSDRQKEDNLYKILSDLSRDKAEAKALLDATAKRIEQQ